MIRRKPVIHQRRRERARRDTDSSNVVHAPILASRLRSLSPTVFARRYTGHISEHGAEPRLSGVADRMGNLRQRHISPQQQRLSPSHSRCHDEPMWWHPRHQRKIAPECSHRHTSHRCQTVNLNVKAGVLEVANPLHAYGVPEEQDTYLLSLRTLNQTVYARWPNAFMPNPAGVNASRNHLYESGSHPRRVVANHALKAESPAESGFCCTTQRPRQ